MSNWEQTAADARQTLLDQIKPYSSWAIPSNEDIPSSVLDVASVPLDKYLSPLSLQITETADVGVLLGKMANGEWSCLDVTTAYCHRALIAHKLTNCLTQVFFDQALNRAKDLDDYLATHEKPIGPLHGLPVSLKCQVSVKGIDQNMGYVGWLGKKADKDSVMTKLLLQQGAILYLHTNVPQSLMLTETINNIYGETTNPFNRSLTCGGSSGGEGALVGFKGSPIGVGSDIGGSIRIPAAFQGLYGLRPSYNRLPYEGSVNSMQGQPVVSSVLGPISSSLNGLKIFTKSLVDAKPWLYDPAVSRQPWDESAYQLEDRGGLDTQLCFALLRDDGVCKPAPPYERALEMTKKALEKAGHKVVEWKFPEAAKGIDIITRLYTADGGKDIMDTCAMSGEPRTGWLLKGDEPHLTTYEYWQLCREKNEYLVMQLEAIEATKELTGTGRPFDAVISPVSAHPSQVLGKQQYIGYTALINLLDYATTVFPVTKVDKNLDNKTDAHHEFRSPLDKMVYESWDPETYKNAPVSLQCIGRKREEEVVIRLTEIIAEALARA